jgi:hypothetical protein
LLPRDHLARHARHHLADIPRFAFDSVARFDGFPIAATQNIHGHLNRRGLSDTPRLDSSLRRNDGIFPSSHYSSSLGSPGHGNLMNEAGLLPSRE